MNVPKLMRRLAVLPVKSGHRKVLARRLGVDPITMKAPEAKVKAAVVEEPKKKVRNKKTPTQVKKDLD